MFSDDDYQLPEGAKKSKKAFTLKDQKREHAMRKIDKNESASEDSDVEGVGAGGDKLFNKVVSGRTMAEE